VEDEEEGISVAETKGEEVVKEEAVESEEE